MVAVACMHSYNNLVFPLHSSIPNYQLLYKTASVQIMYWIFFFLLTAPPLRWTPSQGSGWKSSIVSQTSVLAYLNPNELWKVHLTVCVSACDILTQGTRKIQVLKPIWIVFSVVTIKICNEDAHVSLYFCIVWIIYKKNHGSIKVLQKTDYIFKSGNLRWI